MDSLKGKGAVLADASVYEIEAFSFVTPITKDALTEVVKTSIRQRHSITLRAGGTSLGGQAIGSGVVIDVSKHLINILQFSPDKREVVVEPGVIQDDLNQFVAREGLRFAPDTSTSNRAMIGGMIGNNSCGSYSVYYGTTREHVKSMEVILSDGSEVVFEALDTVQLHAKLNQQDFEGALYRTVIELLENHGERILEQFPHPSIKRRNTGYALDELYRYHQPFNPEGKPFNLAPLICGSEGTLAVVKTATLNLVALPKHRQLICAHFESIEAAMRVVSDLLKLEPAAIELIDRATLDGTKQNRQQQANRFWIEGEPDAVLVCEWFAEDLALLATVIQNSQAWLIEHGAYSAPIIPVDKAANVWAVRKAGLGLLMGKVARKKAVAVIEDGAVPVANLFEYYQEVVALMAELKVNCVYYGHASVGLIHIRPEIDLATEQGKRLFTTIAERNSKLIKKYRGALSGEHGDGRIRAPYIKEQVGDEVYECLVALKRAFDPHNLLNPGVIIGDAPITANLRAARQPQQRFKTGFDWSNDLSLMDAVEKCNGAGACRKSAGNGVMCPSYQASREENYSTRGRSNLLRFALTEADPIKSLSNTELQDALEMCLGCKACHTECPASVDMAKLKSEVLFQSHQGFSLRRLSLKHYGMLMKVAAQWPAAFNGMQNLALVKKSMGVDVRRTLPAIQAQSLQRWWREQASQAGASTEQATPSSFVKGPLKVGVLCDLFSQYQEPEVGRAVIESLQKLGVTVIPVFMTHSPRALISSGLLVEAKQALKNTLLQLSSTEHEIDSTDFIIGIEPSELLVWRDEARSLLSNQNLEMANNGFNQTWLNQKKPVLSYEELILGLNAIDALPILPSLNNRVHLHVHCHQKALANPMDTQAALQLIPNLRVNMIQSGCCGMSGEFGYRHFEMSKKIAEQALLPAIAEVASNEFIVATGTSCRHQVADLSEKRAMHVAQVFSKVLLS
ncbi:MAG: FAD-binding oxidoreductase [Gammaproteobacteria bacterium]|nr:FAD-binding oxidoreductase [Gammaproteobacteria bacterium]